MQGTNLNEGNLFEPFYFNTTFTFVPGGRAQFLVDHGIRTFPQLVGIISGTTADPAKVGTLATLYPPANYPNPDNNDQPSADQALGQIYGDINITCAGLASNQLLAGFVPVYAYEFADPNAPNVFLPRIGFSYGARTRWSCRICSMPRRCKARLMPPPMLRRRRRARPCSRRR